MLMYPTQNWNKKNVIDSECQWPPNWPIRVPGRYICVMVICCNIPWHVRASLVSNVRVDHIDVQCVTFDSANSPQALHRRRRHYHHQRSQNLFFLTSRYQSEEVSILAGFRSIRFLWLSSRSSLIVVMVLWLNTVKFFVWYRSKKTHVWISQLRYWDISVPAVNCVFFVVD